MNRIVIHLPANRDFAGKLEIQNPAGKRVAGPFCVCGRADDQAAKSNGNPGRDPLLPFGDIPFGEYQVVKIMSSGPGTSYGVNEFGSAGVILLCPKSGEAALAEANGRFGFFIQAGARSKNRLLRPTQDGSLRLSDRDQRRFIKALQKASDIQCPCLVVCTAKSGGKVAVAPTTPAGQSRLKSSATLLLAGSMVASTVTGTIRQALIRKLVPAAAASITASLLTESHASAQNSDDGGYGSVPAIVQLEEAAGAGTAGYNDVTQYEQPNSGTKDGGFGTQVANPSDSQKNDMQETGHGIAGAPFDGNVEQYTPASLPPPVATPPATSVDVSTGVTPPSIQPSTVTPTVAPVITPPPQMSSPDIQAIQAYSDASNKRVNDWFLKNGGQFTPPAPQKISPPPPPPPPPPPSPPPPPPKTGLFPSL